MYKKYNKHEDCNLGLYDVCHLSCCMRSSPSLMTLTVACRVVCCCWPKRLIKSWTASTDSAYTSSSNSFWSSSSHVHSYQWQTGKGEPDKMQHHVAYTPLQEQRKKYQEAKEHTCQKWLIHGYTQYCELNTDVSQEQQPSCQMDRWKMGNRSQTQLALLKAAVLWMVIFVTD